MDQGNEKTRNDAKAAAEKMNYYFLFKVRTRKLGRARFEKRKIKKILREPQTKKALASFYRLYSN